MTGLGLGLGIGRGLGRGLWSGLMLRVSVRVRSIIRLEYNYYIIILLKGSCSTNEGSCPLWVIPLTTYTHL